MMMMISESTNRTRVRRKGRDLGLLPGRRPANGGRSPFGAAIDATGSPSLFEQTRDEQYRILLVQVAKVARGMPFPGHNPIFDIPVILQNLQGNVAGQKSFRFYISDQAEWQRMVGAAGELFVSHFLILSCRL